jgi:imidazolonepropionase-like amidohydrolase
MTNPRAKTVFVLIAVLATISPWVSAQDETANQILLTNVQIFDGVNARRMAGNVLVEGNLIKQVSADTIDAPGATVIDGGGRTLMPGLIDMHSHLCIQEGMLVGRDDYDQMAMGARTAKSMIQYLDQGFTTARDVGCNVLGVAKAVNNGLIDGPRIYPAGGFLSQTGGHADTGSFNDVPGRVDDLERHGFGYIVDGVTEVRRAARQNFRSGATHLKLMAGGGVASEFDPLHATQFSVEEFEAAVEVAKDYGSYVTVHAYHDRSVNRAIDAGVRCIEHNFLVSEETIIRMKKEGVALSIQAFMSVVAFSNPEEITFFNPDQKAKGKMVNSGAIQMLKWARKHELIMATGGDMFGPAYNGSQALNMTILTTLGFTPYEILKMGTSNAAEILTWSGGMNPYKYGTLGTIAVGGYADMILVEGNPLDDIKIIEDYANNFKVIMKDGVVWKNTLN